MSGGNGPAARVEAIWRHPIKGIGREALPEVELEAGRPMPLDRAWALLQEGASDTDDWQPRRNFLQAAAGPSLMAATAAWDGERLTLTHPGRPDLTLDPDRDGDALRDWIRPVWPDERPAPARLVRAPSQSMADNGYASVSILNAASLRALSDAAGESIDARRFRGNLLVEGLEPWEEWGWLGRTVAVGGAELTVSAKIGRCRATEADPETGERRLDPVRLLREGWGHTDFGVYAVVATSGRAALGDRVST